MRGRPHLADARHAALLPARDLPVYFGALSTYTHHLRQGWVRYFGVTREQAEQLVEMHEQALAQAVGHTALDALPQGLLPTR